MILLASCAVSTDVKPQKSWPQGQGKLVLEVSGLRNDDGDVFVSIFPGRSGFPDDINRAVVNLHNLPLSGQCRIEVDLPYGEYAVSVLHDEDRDGRMATNLVGIPREGFGFSGNPQGKLGPPDYADVRFLLLVPEKRLSIVMQYETVGREKQRLMQERSRAGSGS